MKINCLKINTSKTKFMLFHKKIRKFNALSDFKIQIGENQDLEQVDDFKYLGLTIDKELRWRQHVGILIKKLSRALGVLFKVRHYLNKKTLLLIFHSIFLSHLKYGILCWGRIRPSFLKPLSILLNRALRCINFSYYRDSATPLYFKEKILKVQDLFNFEVLKFMFKYKSGNLPSNFNVYFEQTHIEHAHNTRHSKHNMYLKRKHTTKGMESLNFLGVKLWSQVPDRIKRSRNCHTFAKQIKTFLIDKYNEEIF